MLASVVSFASNLLGILLAFALMLFRSPQHTSTYTATFIFGISPWTIRRAFDIYLFPAAEVFSTLVRLPLSMLTH